MGIIPGDMCNHDAPPYYVTHFTSSPSSAEVKNTWSYKSTPA